MGSAETIIEKAGIKPTSNRILVLRELIGSGRPLSLGELESNLLTLEKSSILRTLSTFQKHHLVHSVEDGRGVIKYELCHGYNDGMDNDMHVHFYCEECQKVICFDDIPVPSISVPGDYTITSVNYMLKGICPDCSRKNHLNHQ